MLQNASRAPSPSNVGPATCANVSSVACCSSTLPRSTTTSNVQPAPTATYTPGPLYTSSANHTLRSTSAQKPSISFAPQTDPAQAVVDTFFTNGTAYPTIYSHSCPNTATHSRPASPSFTLNIPTHHTQITHDFTDLDNKNDFSQIPDTVCPYPPPSDVSKIKVQEIKNPEKPRGNDFYSLLLNFLNANPFIFLFLARRLTKHISFVCFSGANFLFRPSRIFFAW